LGWQRLQHLTKARRVRQQRGLPLLRVTAPYKYPRAIELIDELPKTMTGKILRRTLKDLEIKRTHTV